MYYTNQIDPYIAQLLNEMIFWVSLSQEQPLLIKEMAACKNINIPMEEKKLLNQNFCDFKELKKDFMTLQQKWYLQPYTIKDPKRLLIFLSNKIHTLLITNANFLNSLENLEDLRAKDKKWRFFIHHITLEQKHFLQLLSNYSVQVKSMGC